MFFVAFLVLNLIKCQFFGRQATANNKSFCLGKFIKINFNNILLIANGTIVIANCIDVENVAALRARDSIVCACVKMQ